MHWNVFIQKKSVIVLLALFSCFLWGSAFPSIKTGYMLLGISQTSGKIFFAGVRFFIAAMMIFIACRFARYSLRISRQSFIRVSMLGMIQTALQYLFFYIGMSHTSGMNGSVISASSAFMTVILAGFFHVNEKPGMRQLLGVVLGFSGILLLNWQGDVSGGFRFIGEGFVMISSLFGAFSSIYLKKLTVDIHPFVIAGYQLLIGSVVLIIVGLGGVQDITITSAGVLLTCYMAFISAAAFSIWSLLIKYNSVSKISIFKSSIPLFGVFLSWLFLNETSHLFFVMMAVIFVSIGILIINIEFPLSNRS